MRFDTEDISKILQNPRSLQTVIGVVLILLAFSSGVTAGEYSYSMESGLLRFALFVVGLGLIFVPMYVQIKTSGIDRESLESVLGHADKMAAIGESALIHADIMATLGETALDAVREIAALKATLHTESMNVAEAEISQLSQSVDTQAAELENVKKLLTGVFILGKIEKDSAEREIRSRMSKFYGMLLLLIHSVSKTSPGITFNEIKSAYMAGQDEDPPPESIRLAPYYFAARLTSVALNLSIRWHLTVANFAEAGKQIPKTGGGESVEEIIQRIVHGADDSGYKIIQQAISNPNYDSLEGSFEGFFT